MPGRSLKTYVVSLGCVHDSAASPSMGKTPGGTDGPALYLRRRLCVKEYAMWVLYEIVRCGSKCGGSQARMVATPPRLGVWASARPGRRGPPRAAPAARAAAPLKRSRRRRERAWGSRAGMVVSWRGVIASREMSIEIRDGGPLWLGDLRGCSSSAGHR